MSLSSPESHRVARAPASQPVFPDEILEEIFLRLDAAEDLARASAACTTFHRVVSARRFLRRFRCLHPPPVLAFLELDKPGAFHPAAEPPHRSAPAARALAQAADSTFSFLDTPDLWQVCDARDGRVLLYRRIGPTTAFADLVVCDPLHRRHVQLPPIPIPDDLAGATAGASDIKKFEPFLAPATDKEEEQQQDLSFRVICSVYCRHKLLTFNFSSVTGKWCGIDFNRTKPLHPLFLRCPQWLQRHCAYGCFYWSFCGRNSFMLNVHDMKFSVDHHPPGSRYRPLGHPRRHTFVELGGGRLGLVKFGNGVLELSSKTLRDNGVGTEEWRHDKTIPLPKNNCSWRVVGAAKGYLLLKATATRDGNLLGSPHYFILDLKTLLIERLCTVNQRAVMYASFPPPFSLPSI